MGILFANVSFSFVRGTEWKSDDVEIVDSQTLAPVSLEAITGMMMRIRDYDDAILMELSMVNGRIVIVDAPGGKIGFRVPSAITRAMPEAFNIRRSYKYDVIIERTPNEYEPAIRGKIIVHPQVTKPWSST